MSRLIRAGRSLGSLCSPSRLLGPRANSWNHSPRLIRSFSNTSRRAWVVKGADSVPDPITGNLRRRTPGAPPLTSHEIEDAAACRRAIEEGESPEVVFASKLHSGTLSMAAAAVCLTEASQRNYSETKLGQTTLAWLWDQRCDLVYPDHNDLVYAMVNLLVREGQEEEIWRWMSCK